MSLGAFGVAAGVVVGAGVVVEGAGVGHVPDRDEDRVLDGDDGLLRAAAGGDAAVSGAEVGAVGVARTTSRRRRARLEVGVAGPGAWWT